jgi:hypothetical protein
VVDVVDVVDVASRRGDKERVSWAAGHPDER